MKAQVRDLPEKPLHFVCHERYVSQAAEYSVPIDKPATCGFAGVQEVLVF